MNSRCACIRFRHNDSIRCGSAPFGDEHTVTKIHLSSTVQLHLGYVVCVNDPQEKGQLLLGN